MQQWNELGYPGKLYLYAILFIGTVIGMFYVVHTRLPAGGSPPYLFIIWNTTLAWIPLGLAVILDLISLIPARLAKLGLYAPTGLLWLFFYPNAAYMITDLLHPFNRYPIAEGNKFWLEISFWDHLFTLLFAGLLGLALASVSLASVHQLVRKAWGSLTGWGFALIVLLLSSFGIYLGRFIRWNSWDLLRDPGYVLRETAAYFGDAANLEHALSFCKWVFLITLFCYVVLYGFSSLRNSFGMTKREET
ncbi:DUF1361 domain-containing protein [Paenibacillus macerans]|uniref:DUF1361 domain-containing protein n=1 Tax=Paenibacillus macerans TaxID=44252 RepID=UPI003D3111AC